jgi:hypothetical protein
VKLYSDTLTGADLNDALPRGVGIETLSIGRPRNAARGWTVRLYCYGNRRLRNSGRHGAESQGPPAASWDQHGEWMAALYDRDPHARIGPYTGRDDFHTKTDGAYLARARHA